MCSAGQQLYAVFQSIFLGLSDGKTFDLDTLSTVSHWKPSNVQTTLYNLRFLNCDSFELYFIQGFGSPHDVAISRDGEAMYVVEIGPNSIHKFALE